MRFFRDNMTARYLLRFLYKVLPMVMFVTYPALLAYAFFNLKQDFLKLTLVPLGVFVAVTVLRIIVNEQRPYERYGMPSVFHKDTVGKSFPSRHTASAFIIACAFLYVDPGAGATAMVIAFLIELSRILAGAHYVHDVVAAMAMSLLAGYVFFFMV